jgi:tetratricopeptide (TPR) repeat protein
LAGERILVADFSESAADTLLGDAISQALRLGLARSAVLRVVGGPTVAEALRRMRRSPDTPLYPDVAREVAVREGVKGVLQGQVRQAGGYLITAALEVAATGDRIQAWDVTARDSTDLPAAIERLVEFIRRDAGESLAAIEPGERPWGRTPTTSSLPALRKHVEGLRAFWRGEYLRSADLQEEAIALDPDFGNAHLTLAAALMSAGPISTRALKAWTRAYELRDQLTAAERYAAIANHALYVSGNLPAAIDAYRSHIEATRRSGAGGWYTSYGDALMADGDISEAERVLQEARQAFPTPLNQLALASALVRLGREPEAKAVIGEALARVPGHPALVLAGAHSAAVSGDYAMAHAIADTVYASPSGRVAALLAQGTFDATRGRLREAIVHFRTLERELRERGLAAEALSVAAAVAMLRLRLGERAAASAEMDSVLSIRPVSSMDPLSYPYFRLAFFFAAAGQPVRADALIRRYLRAVPSYLRRPDLRELHRAQAAVRLAQGRPRDALAELREAAKYPRLRVRLFDGAAGTWPHYISVDALPELARVYDRLGMRDSAVAVYERYVGARDLYRTYVDAWELGNALVRLAELQEATGAGSRAAHYHDRLVELWRDADPELRQLAYAGARRAVAGDQR